MGTFFQSPMGRKRKKSVNYKMILLVLPGVKYNKKCIFDIVTVVSHTDWLSFEYFFIDDCRQRFENRSLRPASWIFSLGWKVRSILPRPVFSSRKKSQSLHAMTKLIPQKFLAQFRWEVFDHSSYNPFVPPSDFQVLQEL